MYLKELDEWQTLPTKTFVFHNDTVAPFMISKATFLLSNPVILSMKKTYWSLEEQYH